MLYEVITGMSPRHAAGSAALPPCLLHSQPLTVRTAMTGLDSVSQMIIILSAVLLLGRLGEYIFSKTSIPDMLWLVLAGILAGPVFNLIPAEILLPSYNFV